MFRKWPSHWFLICLPFPWIGLVLLFNFLPFVRSFKFYIKCLFSVRWRTWAHTRDMDIVRLRCVWYFKKLNTYRCWWPVGTWLECIPISLILLASRCPGHKGLRVNEKPGKTWPKRSGQVGLNLRISCHCICQGMEGWKKGRGKSFLLPNSAVTWLGL